METEEELLRRKRERCDYATIQSDAKGQFQTLIRHLENSSFYDDQLKHFNGLTKDTERIEHASQFVNCVKLEPLFRKKDAQKSAKLRQIGNEAFQKRNITDALKAYNASILSAPVANDLPHLSLSLANRSACFFHLQDYAGAINDIQHAIGSGYPQEQKYKLYIRMAKCHLKLENGGKALTAASIAKQLLEETGQGDKVPLLSEIDQLIQESKELIGRVESDVDTEKLCQEEEHLPAEEAFEVRYSPGKGRHLVSRRRLNVGEECLSEEPLSAVLYPDQAGLHCQLCFARLRCFVPCPGCSGVAFCSFSCRDEALASFHRHECQYGDVMTGLGCSQVARLAFRIVAQTTFDKLLELRRQLALEEACGDFWQKRADSQDKYVQMFGLLGHRQRRSQKDLFQRTLMAALLLKILQAPGKYFPFDASNFQINYVGSLLLNSLEVLQFNAHEIYEAVRASKASTKPCKNRVIALGIYPTIAYMNHSCHGTVAKYFQGRKMVLRTLTKVAKGDALQENYGPTFYFKSRQERQEHLDTRYWFHCQCPACVNDWPLLARLPKSKSVGLAPLLEAAHTQMKRGQPENAFRHLCQFVENYDVRDDDDINAPPTEELIRAEDHLRTCISLMGNVIFLERGPTNMEDV